MINLKQYLHFEKKQKKQLFNFALQGVQILAFFILAFIIFYLGISIEWSVFSERDISRAVAWLNGNFYWPGPEMSGGNNLPGPFFYFLLFPAILVGDNVYSQTVLWTITWFALTYTVAFSFISKITSHKETLLIFLITFIFSIKNIIYSWAINAEFAVMFHVLALIGLYYWREKRSSIYLYLTGLVIALGIQVHLLVAIHSLTVLLFYIIDKSERKKLKALLLFLLIAFSSMLIYKLLKNFHVFETSGNYNNEHINHVLENIFSEKWFRNIKRHIIPFVPSFILYFVFIVSQKKKLQKWTIKSSTKNLLIITAIPFLVAFLVARKFWYLLFMPVFFIILISKCFDNLLPNNSNKKINFLLVYTIFNLIYVLLLKYESITFLLNPFKLIFIENQFALYIFFFIFFILAVTSFQWHNKIQYKSILLGFFLFILAQISALYVFPKNFSKASYPKKSFSSAWPSYKELYPLMKRIYLDTGWSPKTTMQKILSIGTRTEISLLTYYTMTVENLNKSITPPPHFPYNTQNTSLKQNHSWKENTFTKDKLTGYFIIQHLQNFIEYKQENWKSYLSQSSLLSPILSREIKEKKIVILKPKLYKSYWLIPYKTTENSLFPEGFHNIGQPYYWEEPDWLKECNQTQTFKNENGLFYCKVLPGHLQKAGLNIYFSKNIQKEVSFSLIIQSVGPLLASPVPSVNLNGVESWSDIQIYLDCNNKSFHRFLPAIGIHNWDTFDYPKKHAKTLIAPLKLKIPLKNCKKNDIKKIKLTWTEKHKRQEQKKEHVVWKLD